MMTPQEMINLPGYGSGEQSAIAAKQWDYDYPAWMIGRIQEITGVELSEYQRNQLIDMHYEILEGYQ